MDAILNKPVRSARKARGAGHLRRAEILSAAERIFVSHGRQGATIRKIACEAGLSSTALYMHFRDKDEILLEICHGALNALAERYLEILRLPIDAATRARMMLEGYVRFGLDNPSTYRLAFCSFHETPEAAAPHPAAGLVARCLELFESAVAEVAAEGRLRARSAESAAQALWVACHGLVACRLNRPGAGWAPEAELTAVMLDGLFEGLFAA